MNSRSLVRLFVLSISAFALLCPAAGAKGDRIVNAQYTAQVPWQVALVSNDGGTPDPSAVFCGGTIRDATHVVTAAHCVPGSLPGDLAVVAGMYDRTLPSEGTRQISDVTVISSDPNYDPVATDNDLAVLTISPALTLGGSVQSRPVQNVGDAVIGRSAWVSGWGTTSEGGSQPSELLIGAIDVYPDSTCSQQSSYGTDFHPNTMLCAGRTLGGGAVVDSCQGDSGGPLIRLITGQPENAFASYDVQIGVVSWGVGCARPNFPGIYTDLGNSELNARAKEANPVQRPIPQAQPQISGSLTVGEVLTCESGGWRAAPTSFEYLWFIIPINPDGSLDTGNAQAVHDEQQMRLLAEDEGKAVGCRVRAKNSGGYDDQFSDAYGPIGAADAGGGGGGGGGGLGTGTDFSRPRSAFTRRGCVRRTCTLTLLVSDSGGVSGMRVRASMQRLNCPRGRRGRRCRRARRLRARQVAPGIFQITARGLKPGRYRFTAVATDASGNSQGAPTRVVLRVKRR